MWPLNETWSRGYYEQTIKKVLMTGFAPFAGLETNPSWEGVNSMETKEIENKYNIILYQEQIPVRYVDVDLIVPLLLGDLRPDLTIHVGVNANASCFVLEKRANRKGYDRYGDVDGQFPANYQNLCDGPDSIDTDLDVEYICHEFNGESGDDLQATSDDAGLYICEYIYYTSLCHGRSPTLFVHVPLDKYKPEQLARGLERILELCLKQLVMKALTKIQ